MDKKRQNYFIVGLATLLALIGLCVFLYKERVIVSDMSFLMTYLLIEQKPYFFFVRIVAVLPQFFALVAIWCHCSLQTAMIILSMSTQLLYLIIYLVAFKFSKKRILFFLVPLNLVLLVNEVFFWPVSEVQQGLIWLCLYAVFLFEKKWEQHSLLKWLGINIAIIIWVQFLHILLFFPILFLIIYYYDSESALFSRKSFYHLSVCLIVFAIRYKIGTLNWYEKEKMHLGEAIRHNLPHFFSLASVQAFLHRLPACYSLYLLLLAGTLIWLLMHKRYMGTLVMMVFSLGYWILVMISSAEDTRFYSENMLLPLGFMVSLAIVADIIPTLNMNYTPLLFLLIIVIRLGGIYQSHYDYTVHDSVYTPYLDYLKDKSLNGVIVDNKLIDQKKAIVTWSSSYETLLITALVSPDSCRVVLMNDNISKYNRYLQSDTMLITTYEVWGKSQLPERYFKLRGGKYETLTRQP